MTRTWQTPLIIMFGGAIAMLLVTGMRQTFGLFQIPITTEMGWGREVFSLAMAIMGLLMGFLSPITGGIADRFGAGRVLLTGGVLWAVGIYLMSIATTPLMLMFSIGIVIGLGTACSSVSIAMGATGRMVPDHMRSRALGFVAAGASAGQLLLVPLGHGLITWFGWQTALGLLALTMAAMIPAALGLSGKMKAEAPGTQGQNIRQSLAEAVRHRGYLMLTAGFFVCGFHVSFVGVHLPAFAVDKGLSPAVGAWALTLLGAWNVFGSILWGRWGDRYRKKYLLTMLYSIRAVLFLAVLYVPINNVTIFLFAGIMGFTWLSTVPLTTGVVGDIFGVRYLSTLFGVVFASHQVGAFLGAWLGGRIFDATQSYDLMWMLSIGLGVFSALIHLPISDEPLRREEAPGGVPDAVESAEGTA